MLASRPVRLSLVAAALAMCVIRTLAGVPVQSQSFEEIVARGFESPIGVAVSSSGAIAVADSKAGTVTELAANGSRRVLLQRLDAPAGIAFDADGGLLVSEEQGGRILRRDSTGGVAVVASGLEKPTWIASGDRATYVVTRSERVVQVLASGSTRVFADGLKGIEGLAVHGGVLYAAVQRRAADRGRDGVQLVAWPVRPDGSAGPMQVLMRGGNQGPIGTAADRLGALFASIRLEEGRGNERGAVIKRLPDGALATVASGLRNVRGIAFEPAGHLLVVEGEPLRQVRRLRAPAPPALTVPAFTNRSPVPLSGHAGPGDLVRAFRENEFAGAIGGVVADPAEGRFTLPVSLAPNQETRLSFTATAAGGYGLTSAPASHAIVHDDHQPTVAILEPSPGAHTRGAVTVRARSEDDGSGVASMAVMWDERPAARFDNADPTQPLVVTTTLDTAALDEGGRTLTVTAMDRAGNGVSAAQLVIVDRTPPETRIASGPAPEIPETTATFVVEGADVLSPLLEFSWQLDDGGWSPFGPATTVVLTGLTPGEHRFAVKARDLAGNEDLTPAAQTFTVRSLRVRILEPADGAVITTPSFWIRGVVEGGAGEIAISVAMPPELGGGSLAASVQGGMFVIEVPADPAFEALTVVATDHAGSRAQGTRHLSFALDGSLEQTPDVWPPGGLAPLTVRVGVHGFIGVRISVDFEGDGVVDFDGEPAAEYMDFTYQQAGAYLPVIRFARPDGSITVQRGVVEVYDRAILDAQLQAVWTGFRDALRTRDVGGAVSFIAEERRSAWDEFLRQVPRELLADVDSLFPSITLVEVGAGGAQYEMIAERNGLLFSYAVWFQIDADGHWRLWRF